jgi:MFS transporter, PAT family, beta-lactamase induction signal transducer AmpG
MGLMDTQAARVRHPAFWVPSAYLAEGIPFAMVIWVAGTMFKDLGHSDGEITLATASVGIMWSLKPLYAGFLDMFRTKKFWVLSMEFAMAVLLGLMAFSLSLPNYFHVIIGLLWLIAFASATQDICIDGIYITSLEKDRQAAWIGLQGAFWVTGRIFATSIVVLLAGALKDRAGMDAKAAWAAALSLSLAVMVALGIYNYFMLPQGSAPVRPSGAKEVVTTFGNQIVDFLSKPKIWLMLLFVFLYRSGEGFLLVEAPLFMQAKLADGGLGLSLENKGLIDGLISTVVSLGGGITGGAFIARYGLKRSLVFMALCMNVPHLCYVILSQLQTPDAPMSFVTIGTLVTIEKFGYSFGFVANMLYMMQQISPGKYHMTHYAFCTALMNLVLIPTQASSGWIADQIGYKSFFLFVMVASIPSVIAAWFAPFPHTPEGAQAATPERRRAPAEAV